MSGALFGLVALSVCFGANVYMTATRPDASGDDIRKAVAMLDQKWALIYAGYCGSLLVFHVAL